MGDGGPQLGLDVVPDDGNIPLREPLGPLRIAGDKHRNVVYESHTCVQGTLGIEPCGFLGAHRQVIQEYLDPAILQRLDDFPEDQLDSAFDELFAINVKGCIMGAKAAIPELEKSQGSMVFTASGAGLNSQGGGPLYTASKHAVVGLVRQLAVELAPSIRVNAVAPGGVLTDLRGLAAVGEDQRSQFSNPSTETRMQAGNPLGLAMNPEDLAGAYVFLSSRENARGVTGTILSVDAGSNLRWMRAT